MKNQQSNPATWFFGYLTVCMGRKIEVRADLLQCAQLLMEAPQKVSWRNQTSVTYAQKNFG